VVSEKGGFRCVKLFGELSIGRTKDFPKIFMDRRVIVDDKNAVIVGLRSLRY